MTFATAPLSSDAAQPSIEIDVIIAREPAPDAREIAKPMTFRPLRFVGLPEAAFVHYGGLKR
jgi:hypothetical protein